MKKIMVWDLATRFFHWILVVLVFCQFVSGFLYDLDTHYLVGTAIFCLLCFRVVWGFVGSETSRFKHFVKGFSSSKDYLIKIIKNQKSEEIGHNPVGGWVIMLMISGLFAQVLSGLFAIPLSYLIKAKYGEFLWNFHKLFAYVLMGLFFTHIIANFFYLIIRKENLITPMITGYKKVNEKIKLKIESSLKATIIFLTISVFVGYLYGEYLY